MASSEQIEPDEDGRFEGTDWILAPDEEGRYYYWNEVSEESSYCKPEELGGYVPAHIALLAAIIQHRLTLRNNTCPPHHAGATPKAG